MLVCRVFLFFGGQLWASEFGLLVAIVNHSVINYVRSLHSADGQQLTEKLLYRPRTTSAKEVMFYGYLAYTFVCLSATSRRGKAPDLDHLSKLCHKSIILSF